MPKRSLPAETQPDTFRVLLQLSRHRYSLALNVNFKHCDFDHVADRNDLAGIADEFVR